MVIRKGKRKTAKTNENDFMKEVTTPLKSSPLPKSRLSQQEKLDLIENLEIEVQDRLRKLRANISVHMTSVEIRGQIAIAKVPKAILSLTVEEFEDKYGGTIQGYFDAITQERQHELRIPDIPRSAKKRKRTVRN